MPGTTEAGEQEVRAMLASPEYGTSLSEGWGLITRFSEDIDLFRSATYYVTEILRIIAERPGNRAMSC